MKKLFFILFALSVACSEGFAQQFVYNPINPSFVGGNAYNGSWLLSSAQSQNTLTEPTSSTTKSASTELDDFKETLNRQILNQLSRQIVSDAFGENALEEGRYELGDYIIDVADGGTGVTITIYDTLNGGETTIEVPYY